jgi:hypothetical protein
VTILREALSILARFFGLQPGPDVEKLPEPKRELRMAGPLRMNLGAAQSCPLVGCERVGPHDHAITGPHAAKPKEQKPS